MAAGKIPSQNRPQGRSNRSAGTVLPAQTTDLSSPALRLPRLALPECPQRAESDAGYLNPRFPPCNRVFSRSMYPKMSVSTYVCATAPRECIHLQIKRAYFLTTCSPSTLRQINLSVKSGLSNGKTVSSAENGRFPSLCPCGKRYFRRIMKTE